MDPLTRPDVPDGRDGVAAVASVASDVPAPSPGTTDAGTTDAGTTDAGDGFHLLHPVAATIWRFGSVATALVVGGGASAIAFATAGVHPVSLCLAALTAVWLVLGSWFPQQRYRHWSYRIGDAALELRHGVWFRTSAAVPFHRIQQIDVEQGPIQRRSGVVTLRLRTAAALSEGTVPHLASAEAERLRARLLEAARAARVVDDGH